MIYVRVSTDEQAEEGYSLGAQEQACRDLAERQERLDQHVYLEDGYSAKDMNRPHLQRLLSEMQTGDAIYVWRLDRFSRDMEDTMGTLKRLRKLGAEMHSVTEGRIDVRTAADILNVGVRAVFNQYQREVIAENTAMGWKRRVESGKPYSNRPYGFVQDSPDWQIDPEQAEVVRRIARWRLEGNGYYTITRLLAEAGIPGPNGGRWYGGRIHDMLRNPIYIGDVRFGATVHKGGTEPILDTLTWQRLQTLNAARARSRTRFAAPYLLSGLLFCTCGRSMNAFVAMPKRGKDGNPVRVPSYRCNSRAVPWANHTNVVVARTIDVWVLEHLEAIAAGEDVPFEVAVPKPANPDARLAALDRELDALEDALLAGRITGERYDRRKERLDAERAAVLQKSCEHADVTAFEQQAVERARQTLPRLKEQYLRRGFTPEMKAAMQEVIERVDLGPPRQRYKRGLAGREVNLTLRAID